MSDAIPPGDPGHSNGHASIRLRPVRIDDDGMIRQGYTTQWELLCPACGDDGTKDYSAVPPEIQRVRGPYPNVESAEVALERHVGLNTRRARLG
jgi:hypothetical protein